MRPEQLPKHEGLLVLEQFLPYRLSVLSNTVSSRIAKFYGARFQLTIPEWRVMAVLGRFPGLTAAEVTERTAMDKVQVSRAVARLQKTCRIEQRAVEGDRRARHLFLTQEGQDVYEEIVPLARDYEQRIIANLNASERVQLNRLLDKLTAAAGTL
ncbi:MAG: MarR family winged helix-turn-helix transcriptional regulator [Alphaproteobacteria bacterium]|nr:MarR family winged helix-turn-helix transcriptional regulator [Alphaproteobacteria bacterium]